MYFSRVRMAPNQLQHLAKQLQYNHYQLHQLLWQLFRDKPEKQRDFLFRRDLDNQGLPVYYVLSKYLPQPMDNTWIVESKPFQPVLKTGDLLVFSLHANPVVQAKQQRTPDEALQHAAQRKANHLTDKNTKKRIHHDVVMSLKHALSSAELEHYSQAELEQLAGERWLNQRAANSGFRVHSVIAQGYQQHHFKKRQIKISTLDFEGVLEVTEPELFMQKIYAGLGRSKAFGCGLLMIKRL